jgi:hypothetical protein
MGFDDSDTRKVYVDLLVLDASGDALPNDVEVSFLQFNENALPDYDNTVHVNMGGAIHQMPSPLPANRRYWRDAAAYHRAFNRLIRVRFSLANRSDFPLSDAKVEVVCSTIHEEQVVVARAADLPERPQKDWSVIGSRGWANDSSERMVVDKRGSEPICHIRFGRLLPGEVLSSHDDLALLPSGPGEYILRMRILAGEIDSPIMQEHVVRVSGSVREMNFRDLKDLEHIRQLQQRRE